MLGSGRSTQDVLVRQWAHRNASSTQKLLAPAVLTSTLCCRRVGSEAKLWEYSFRCTVGTKSRAVGSRREVRLGIVEKMGFGELGPEWD